MQLHASVTYLEAAQVFSGNRAVLSRHEYRNGWSASSKYTWQKLLTKIFNFQLENDNQSELMSLAPCTSDDVLNSADCCCVDTSNANLRTFWQWETQENRGSRAKQSIAAGNVFRAKSDWVMHNLCYSSYSGSWIVCWGRQVRSSPLTWSICFLY